MLHSSATSWRHRFHLHITLSRGTLTLAGILSSSKSYGEETLTIAKASPDESQEPLEEVKRYAEDPSWSAEISEFGEAILGNGNIVNGSARDAYKTMELVYRIYCADRHWKNKWGLSWKP